MNRFKSILLIATSKPKRLANRRLPQAAFGLCLLYVCLISGSQTVLAQTADGAGLGSLNQVSVQAELKTVKLYGAGGIAGLDSYQSGFFISADGYILTAWSTVLDVDQVLAVTSDGTRLEAELRGIDPNLELAVLATGEPTSHYFDLTQAVDTQVGTRVLALSNLFRIAAGSEMASVQRGVIMARTELNARRGSFESVYQGPVWIIDATTNNPGAAGGALVDLQGRLVGMLGKELRDKNANIWLNYALPIGSLKASVQSIIEGKSLLRAESRPLADRPASCAAFGLVLIPNVLNNTPAYVDVIQPGSPADRAGLQSDDLILFLNSFRIGSQNMLEEELKYLDRKEQVVLLIQRGKELKELVLTP